MKTLEQLKKKELIKNDIIGYIKELKHGKKKEVFFDDNILVKKTKNRAEFFRIQVSSDGAFFDRYAVPGRYDLYCFFWNLSHEQGVGDTVSLFSDLNYNLQKALKMVKEDLKKPQVKELIEEASINKWYKTVIDTLISKLK